MLLLEPKGLKNERGIIKWLFLAAIILGILGVFLTTSLDLPEKTSEMESETSSPLISPNEFGPLLFSNVDLEYLATHSEEFGDGGKYSGFKGIMIPYVWYDWKEDPYFRYNQNRFHCYQETSEAKCASQLSNIERLRLAIKKLKEKGINKNYLKVAIYKGGKTSFAPCHTEAYEEDYLNKIDQNRDGIDDSLPKNSPLYYHYLETPLNSGFGSHRCDRTNAVPNFSQAMPSFNRTGEEYFRKIILKNAAQGGKMACELDLLGVVLDPEYIYDQATIGHWLGSKKRVELLNPKNPETLRKAYQKRFREWGEALTGGFFKHCPQKPFSLYIIGYEILEDYKTLNDLGFSRYFEGRVLFNNLYAGLVEGMSQSCESKECEIVFSINLYDLYPEKLEILPSRIKQILSWHLSDKKDQYFLSQNTRMSAGLWPLGIEGKTNKPKGRRSLLLNRGAIRPAPKVDYTPEIFRMMVQTLWGLGLKEYWIYDHHSSYAYFQYDYAKGDVEEAQGNPIKNPKEALIPCLEPCRRITPMKRDRQIEKYYEAMTLGSGINFGYPDLALNSRPHYFDPENKRVEYKFYRPKTISGFFVENSRGPITINVKYLDKQEWYSLKPLKAYKNGWILPHLKIQGITDIQIISPSFLDPKKIHFFGR